MNGQNGITLFVYRFPSVRANGGIAAVTSRKAPPSSSPARSQLLPKADAGTISPAPPTVMKSPGRARSAAAAGNTAGQDSKRKSLPPEPVATEVTSKRTRWAEHYILKGSGKFLLLSGFRIRIRIRRIRMFLPCPDPDPHKFADPDPGKKVRK